MLFHIFQFVFIFLPNIINEKLSLLRKTVLRIECCYRITIRSETISTLAISHCDPIIIDLYKP